MYSLGIDIGSSSVKVSLLDIASGKCVKSVTNPRTEAPIRSPQKGWAEQVSITGRVKIGSEQEL